MTKDNKKRPKTQTIYFDNEELSSQIKILATKDGRSISKFICRVLGEFVVTSNKSKKEIQ